MKIVDVSITPTAFPTLANPIADSIIRLSTSRMAAVKVATDHDEFGIAPFAPYGFEAAKAVVETELRRTVIGEDPFDYERIWNKMFWQIANYGSKGVPCYAMGAIDIALWDLRGKVLGVPCHRLLGGFTREVKVYSSGIDFALNNDDLTKQHALAVKEGYSAVKMKVGRRREQEDIERVKAVRDSIGYDTKLMVDANQAWSISQAIRMARRLERYEVFWLEEPTLADNVGGLARIAKSTEIPIALGESEYNKFGFKQLIDRGAVGVVKGTLANVGGITEWKKIAALAEAAGIMVAPQQFDNAGVSALASIPNGLFLEQIRLTTVNKESLIEPVPTVKSGRVQVPNEAGFGWRINERAIQEAKNFKWVPHTRTPPTFEETELPGS